MFKRTFLRLLVLSLAAVGSALLPAAQPAQADNMLDRSVVLSNNLPSGVTSDFFRFTLPSTANIGSITFEYCADSPLIYDPCDAPAGLDVNSAVLTSQTGNTGFSIDAADTTANVIVLSRANSPGAAVPSSYLFNNITNPSTSGQTVFVRMWTHASSDGSGPKLDGGASGFVVQSPFTIGAYIPPFLKFCVGVTVTPDCSSETGDSIDLGTMTSNRASSGQSQFATATNDPSGYVIYALGPTMTSGNNIIPALSSPTASLPGNAQFGFNLRANLSPTVGQDPVGLGTGLPTANYNIPNRYSYNEGDSITTSSLPSNYNRMTVSYVVNVPSVQPPGIYATTITYLATVQF
jgi:hypothetical protein